MELIEKYAYLLPVFSLIAGCVTCLETHTVTIEQGDVIGLGRKLIVKDEEHTSRRYLGIPFAKPPVGELRFKKPQEPEKFTEPFEALTFGAACPQVRNALLPIREELSEDCLFLNIFVPTGKNNEQPRGLPVMVFVHGGAFDLGTGNTYVSDTLASFGNVIVVTINYRLNLFGFLSTHDEHATGNAALWDQHLAFKWVHKNIGAFGGDNRCVTIFGESAGGVSVLMQALYPGNKGLFQRVISESGSALMWLLFKDNHNADNAMLAQKFDCGTKDIVNCLEGMNSSVITEILAEGTNDDLEIMTPITFRPTIDNDFFKMSPFMMRENNDKEVEELEFFRSLDVINGVNSDEGAFIAGLAGGADGADAFEPTREMMNTQLVDSAFAFYRKEFNLTDFVRQLITHEYTDWSNPNEPKTIRAEYSRIMGDLIFNVGAVDQTRMHCSKKTKGRNFFYIFETDSEMSLIPKPKWTNGATHGEELGFVFGFEEEIFVAFNVTDEYSREYRSRIGICEKKLSKRLMLYWSNFAKYGNPNGPEGMVSQAWPQYDLDTQKAFVISEKYKDEESIRSFPFARSVNFWTNIIPEAFSAGRSEHAPDSPGTTSGSCSADGDCDNV